MTEFILKFAGVFLGVLARTLLPWLRKLHEGQVLKFGKRYLHTTAASLAIGFILTLVMFPQLTVPAGGGPGFEAYFKLFCLAFGFGFGWNGLVLEGRQWARPTEKKEKNGG
jgi:cytochrome c biogenesis factor